MGQITFVRSFLISYNNGSSHPKNHHHFDAAFRFLMHSYRVSIQYEHQEMLIFDQ